MDAGNTPSAIAFGSRAVWVANERDSSVTRIGSTTNGTYGRDVNVGLKPAGITVGDGAVWVTDTGDDQVTRIDPSTNSVQSIPVGDAPIGIAYGAAPSGSQTAATARSRGSIRPRAKSSRRFASGTARVRIAFADGKIWVTVQGKGAT